MFWTVIVWGKRTEQCLPFTLVYNGVVLSDLNPNRRVFSLDSCSELVVRNATLYTGKLRGRRRAADVESWGLDAGTAYESAWQWFLKGTRQVPVGRQGKAYSSDRKSRPTLFVCSPSTQR